MVGDSPVSSSSGDTLGKGLGPLAEWAARLLNAGSDGKVPVTNVARRCRTAAAGSRESGSRTNERNQESRSEQEAPSGVRIWV